MHELPQIITVDGFDRYGYRLEINTRKLSRLIEYTDVKPKTIRTIKIFPTSESLEPDLPTQKRSNDFGFWDADEKLVAVNFRLDTDFDDYSNQELEREAIESLAHEIFHASNERTKRILRIVRHIPAFSSVTLGLVATILTETNQHLPDLFAQLNPPDGNNAFLFKLALTGVGALVAGLITNKRIKKYAQKEENDAYAYGQSIANSTIFKDLLQLKPLKVN